MKPNNYSIGISVSIFIIFLIYSFIYADGKGGCVLRKDKMTISTITYGLFQETVPQTGRIVHEDGTPIVKVPIDELYLSRISIDLKASSDIKGKGYQLKISKIYSEVTEGRFSVDMNFIGQVPDLLSNNSIRMRIELGDPSNELLLPVGGFYKDTGGEWIFIKEGDLLVKRKIKLGRKSPDYFEVIEGLKEGDQVISSSYESFPAMDSISISKMKQLVEDNEWYSSILRYWIFFWAKALL